MNFKQALLWPLTLPYGGITRLRARAYQTRLLRQKHLRGTVVSVGNLTVGGTGKTPMTLWLAERLVKEGKKAAILTRGYHGTSGLDGPTSDEAQLLKFRLGDQVALGIGADRYVQGMKLAVSGVEWFILDDGFQHLRLARDADIVLVDAMNPFGGGRLLPAGLMREPKTALRRADVIVITRSDHAPAVEAAVRRESNSPIFYARTELDSVRWVSMSDAGGEVRSAREKKWFVFCGIGNPAAFLANLRHWGFRICGHRFFRDHHRYERQELEELAKEARAAGAEALMCTEKDRFNLTPVASLPIETAYCQISLQVDRGDDFWNEIQTVVAISRSKRPRREAT